MKKNKALFILGGMGPEASNYMYETLIKISIQKFGAKNNDDYPEIILNSVPVPDFISSDKFKNKALKMLVERVEQANRLNISCISIACNTAHVLLEQLQKKSQIPFISMIEEMVKSVTKDKIKTVGLMGTPSTLRYGLYQEKLIKEGIDYVVPTANQINTLERVIRNVVAGKILKNDQDELKKIADFLRKKGAEAIILGCTELPLVFPKNYTLPTYNAVEVLSKALLRIYYGGNTIQR